jgi:hypothetical protein
MRGQPGFWDIEERYARLSEAGDVLELPLHRLARVNVTIPSEAQSTRSRTRACLASLFSPLGAIEFSQPQRCTLSISKR